MADKTFNNIRIQLKADTLSNWQALGPNFIPLKGEIIIVTDAPDDTNPEAPPDGTTVKIKIGDGVTPFANLEYFSTGSSSGGSAQITINNVTSDNFTITPETIGALASDGKAASANTADTLSSTLGIAKGGTGATTALSARSGLGANKIVVSAT